MEKNWTILWSSTQYQYYIHRYDNICITSKTNIQIYTKFILNLQLHQGKQRYGGKKHDFSTWSPARASPGSGEHREPAASRWLGDFWMGSEWRCMQQQNLVMYMYAYIYIFIITMMMMIIIINYCMIYYIISYYIILYFIILIYIYILCYVMLQYMIWYDIILYYIAQYLR